MIIGGKIAMLKFKYIVALLVLFIFFTAYPIQAVVSTGGSTGGSTAGALTGQPAMMKVVGVVNKIENNILYLQSGQKYSLSGVKVEYSKGKPISRRKKMADMFFVNGALKEVTIR
jgi:hypothetical protein